MLPSLGGGSSLRGFSEYRFIDRQAVLGRGELRWMASRVVDVAVFRDEGMVAPTIDALRFQDRVSARGIGARLHSAHHTRFRVEIAHSREGWNLHLGQHVSF